MRHTNSPLVDGKNTETDIYTESIGRLGRFNPINRFVNDTH